MARLAYDSSSEDEFPDVRVIAQRAKQKAVAKTEHGTKVKEKDAPAREVKAKTKAEEKPSIPAALSKGTPLRRRKLGNSQAQDASLLQKWSGVDYLKQETQETTARKPRASRARAKEVRQKNLELSERSSQEPENAASESDDDVLVRRRPQPKTAVQEPRNAREKAPQCKTEAAVTVTELEEDLAQFAESVEISVIVADDLDLSSGDDDASEFVTALSVDTDAESSSSGSDSLPPARRSRSPISQRSKTVGLPPKMDPPERDNRTAKPSASRSQRAGSSDQEPNIPQTPRGKSRKAATKSLKGDDLEDAFKKLQIYAEDLDDSPDTKPRATIQLDPITPKKSLQPSPIKAPKIPPSPWKPEHHEFWDAEIQNEWIDRHSPPKRSPKKPVLEPTDSKALLKLKYGTSPQKRDAKKAFDQIKESLAQTFLAELDDRVTSGELARLTAPTGGMRIKWCTSLQSTAGRAHWKCKEVTTMTQQADGSLQSTKERRHEAWIDLASKVLTNEDDLLNTVAHEFCHLAVFMLNGKPKFAHGAEFKAWGRKCMAAFRGRGIEVTTKHDYEIDYKFIWRCADCTAEVHRHSKSVDTSKQRCGRCRGVLEQVKPVPRANAGKGPGKKTAYQVFVSSETKVLKAEGKTMSFGEMMAEVSKRWKVKQKNKGVAANGGKEELMGLEEEFEELGLVDLAVDKAMN
ncbi:SprT-like family-domain-containing protein [Xylariales sp. AK1849]|nr:SprT-like family-domain-containing protein [Xylariales sp. AK1849]